MYSFNISQLIIDDVLWVFKLDPLATSVHDLNHPKPFTYRGRYSDKDTMEEYLLIEEIDNSLRIKLPVKMDYSVVETGFYILGQDRTRIIEVLRNTAVRPIMNNSTNFVAKEYYNYLVKEKPEWVV